MVKRGVTAVLWAFVAESVFHVVSLLVGAPSGLSLVAAIGVAAFVGIDPLHLFWSARRVEANPRTVVAPSVQHPVRSSN